MAPGLSYSTDTTKGTTEYTGISEIENLSREEEVSDVNRYLKQRNAICREGWAWSDVDKAFDVSLHQDSNKASVTVTFHPYWSNGTAGVRASRPLIGEINYWEIHVGARVFGTSLMFGVTTKKARLQASEFKHLLGEDSQGWALSHRGRIFHSGNSDYFCKTFMEHTPAVIGLLLDRRRGDLTFFKDGVCLGIAFTGLDKIEEDLYPTICSTAAKSVMMVGRRCRSFLSLQDRCRHVIATRVRAAREYGGNGMDWDQQLPLPNKMKEYIRMSL